MTERPILFNAPMVRAILEGTKTQTRRVVRPCKDAGIGCELAPNELAGEVNAGDFLNALCQPGDRLWVRETWAHDASSLEECRAKHEDIMGGGGFYGPYYRATEAAPDTLHWRPSIHMPRWASRLTLQIESIRALRLHTLTFEDIIAEGAPFGNAATADDDFAVEWDAINARRGVPWTSNPWVWAVTFSIGVRNGEQT